jgi:hypothetical protein
MVMTLYKTNKEAENWVYPIPTGLALLKLMLKFDRSVCKKVLKSHQYGNAVGDKEAK